MNFSELPCVRTFLPFSSLTPFDLSLVIFFSDVCKTFGSGVIQAFNKTMFHVRSTCPLTLTHFSYAGVDCFITVHRDPTGFIKRVEILVNKVATIIEDGVPTVEGNRYLTRHLNTKTILFYSWVYTYWVLIRPKQLLYSTAFLND